MRTEPDWRSSSHSADLTNYDFADCAQEFVRRSPDYRSDYAATHAQITAQKTEPSPEMEGLARRWGMTFPLRSNT